MHIWQDDFMDRLQPNKKLQPASMIVFTQIMTFAFKGYNHLDLPIVTAQYDYAGVKGQGIQNTI